MSATDISSLSLVLINCVGAICLAARPSGLFKLYKSQPMPEYPAKIIELSSLEIVGCCRPVKTLVIAYELFTNLESEFWSSTKACL